MAERLTKAQREMLEHICGYSEWGGAPFRARSAGEYYAPLRRLLRRGLIEKRPHPSPKYRSHFVKMLPTEAGRAALQKDDSHD